MMWSATEDGVLRSEDGSTWETLDPPQLIRLLAWVADDTVVGASVEGHLLISHDAGSTWTVNRDPVGEVSALGAGLMADGTVEVLLVVGDSVLRTFDGGETMDRLL